MSLPCTILSTHTIRNPQLHTFVAVGEPPLLAGLDVGNPQVVIVDEGDEVRVSRADLRVHAGP